MEQLKMSSSESDLSLGDPNEMFTSDNVVIDPTIQNWADESEKLDEKKKEHAPPSWKTFISPTVISINEKSAVEYAEGNPWQTEPGKIVTAYRSSKKGEIRKSERANIMRKREKFSFKSNEFPQIGNQKDNPVFIPESHQNREFIPESRHTREFIPESRHTREFIPESRHNREFIPAPQVDEHWSDSLNRRRERLKPIHKKPRKSNNERRRIAHVTEDGWTVVTNKKQKISPSIEYILEPKPKLELEPTINPEPEPEPEPESELELELVSEREEKVEVTKKRKNRKQRITVEEHSKQIKIYQMYMKIMGSMFFIILAFIFGLRT
jgi:hypothetical protein